MFRNVYGVGYSGEVGKRSIDNLPSDCFWYKVMNGDTLSVVSKKHYGLANVKAAMDTIRALNSFIEDENVIFAGDFLCLPTFNQSMAKAAFIPLDKQKEPFIEPGYYWIAHHNSEDPEIALVDEHGEWELMGSEGILVVGVEIVSDRIVLIRKRK